MVLLSAVSAAVALGSGSVQGGLTPPLSPSLAKAAGECTLSVSQYNIIIGQAVLVSPDGYAITPGEVAFESTGDARKNLTAGHAGDSGIPVRVLAFDPVTDLALIRIPVSPDRPVRHAELADKLDSSVVLVMLHAAPARAQVARVSVTGVMGLSKRYVPLNEVRLEQGFTALSGAPVFAPNGRLAGVLMASLVGEQGAHDRSVAAKSFAPGGAALEVALGPRSSATAFSLNLPVLERVISGFLSESRQVRHPWIGLYFVAGPKGGALVTQVVGGGPAAAAGLKEDDVIMTAGGRAIQSHLDLAAYLFNLRVGAVAELGVRRGETTTMYRVTVGTDAQQASTRLRRAAVAAPPPSA